MEEAKQLSLPYFSIIDIPVKKYQLVKKQEERSRAYQNIAGFKSSSPFKQGCIDLFWQINDDSFKNLKKKIQKSPSVRVRKFKFKNESTANPEATAMMELLLTDKNEFNKIEDHKPEI